MAKFEYAIETVMMLEFEHGMELERLSARGKEGWELVSTIAMPGLIAYYFKRGKGCEESLPARPALWGIWSPTTYRWMTRGPDNYEVFHTPYRVVAEAVLHSLKRKMSGELYGHSLVKDAGGWEWQVRAFERRQA